MELVKNAAKIALFAFRRLRARPVVRRMMADPNPQVQAMARALTEALDDQHSVEEREIFARIEARRGVLLGRTDQVMVLD
jgi:hypothetical protein